MSDAPEPAPAPTPPAPKPWEIFLPDAYEPGSRYPCLILLQEPAVAPATLAQQIRPFFHHAARAGILVAVPAAPATSSYPRRNLLPEIDIQALLDDPAVAPAALTLAATGSHALPSLNLLLSRPGQFRAACLVRPQPLSLDPSPLWANLAATPILLALDPAQPAQAPWAERLGILGGDALRLRQLQAPASDVEPLSALAGEMLKFLLAPTADPGAPASFEIVSWRLADSACWWVDMLFPADPAEPLRITAASHPERGIRIETENLASFRLLSPPAHARAATLLTPIQIDGSRLSAWHPADGLFLAQRPGERWATASQPGRPAWAATPPPYPSVRALSEAIHRAARAQGLPPHGRVDAAIPAALLAFLEALDAADPPQDQPPASDLWLDLLEGCRFELAATPITSPAPAYEVRRMIAPETLAGAAATPTCYAEIRSLAPDPIGPAVKGSGNAGPRLLAALLVPAIGAQPAAAATEAAPAAETSPAGATTPAPLAETDLHRIVPR